MPLELASGLTLYFSRHGQTHANLEKRFSGKKDTPLTALGREQAHEVGHSALYLVSDMGRAVTGECLHVDAGYHVVGMKAEDAPDIAVAQKNGT